MSDVCQKFEPEEEEYKHGQKYKEKSCVVESFRVIDDEVTRVVFFGTQALQVRLVEEYLPVAQEPVAQRDHEPRRIGQDLAGCVVHSLPVGRWLLEVIRKQYSLGDVNVDHCEQSDDEKHWQGNTISKSHENGVEHEGVLQRKVLCQVWARMVVDVLCYRYRLRFGLVI